REEHRGDRYVTATLAAEVTDRLTGGRGSRRCERSGHWQLVTLSPRPGKAGDRLVRERVGGAGCGKHERIELAHACLPESIAKSRVEHVEEARFEPEDLGHPDLQPRLTLGGQG